VGKDELRLALEQVEDGSERRLVLDGIVLQGQSTEEDWQNLRDKASFENGPAKQTYLLSTHGIKGHGCRVLDDHSSDTADSVVLGIELILGSFGRNGEVPVEDLHQGGELGAQVVVGPLNQRSGSECSIRAHFGLRVLQSPGQQRKDILGERRNAALEANNDFTQGSNNHRTFIGSSFGAL
jgi:hypothetical protein